MLEAYDIREVDRAEVLRYLGHRGQDVSDELAARLDETVARCLSLARPRGCTRVFDVVSGEKGDPSVGGLASRQVREALSEPGGEAPGLAASPFSPAPEVVLRGCALRLKGADICEHLAGARAVGVMAVTIGIGIDRELNLLSHTDALGQVLFDAAATALVERAADAAEASLVAQAAERDLYVNWRFSPGYGDLPLDTQAPLLAALDAQRRLGLSLTSSDLLVPTKSVTAVIGMFDEPQSSRVELCDKCRCRDFCTIRATGRTCHGKD